MPRLSLSHIGPRAQVVAAALLVFAGAGVTVAGAAGTGVISACVNAAGYPRLITPPDTCKSGETPASWLDAASAATAAALNAEIAARRQGDADTLASARQYTDSQVAAEAAARKQGDADTLASARQSTDSQVAAEAAARKQGDADTLAAARQSTDTQVAAEASVRLSVDLNLSNALTGEIVRAFDAETALTNNLNAEIARAKAAEASLASRPGLTGYVVVTGGSTSSDPHQRAQSAGATCPDGKSVLGGGATVQLLEVSDERTLPLLSQSTPRGTTGWTADARDVAATHDRRLLSEHAWTLVATAICANVAP